MHSKPKCFRLLIGIFLFHFDNIRFGAPQSLPCELESSENGGPDETNSVPPCESLTIEKHVFESSVAKPKFCVWWMALLLISNVDEVVFSLLSFILLLTLFSDFFFCSLLDIGTHL